MYKDTIKHSYDVDLVSDKTVDFTPTYEVMLWITVHGIYVCEKLFHSVSLF